MRQPGITVGILNDFMGFLRLIHFQLIAGIKRGGHIAQRHPILRTFWSCETRFHLIHIQRQSAGKTRLIARVAPQTLRFGIGFH